jgi:hypothetical protein
LSFDGSERRPPSVIVFAPQATRSPPSRIFRTSRCVLNSCRDVVRRELDVGVLEPRDEPERDVLVAHRVR